MRDVMQTNWLVVIFLIPLSLVAACDSGGPEVGVEVVTYTGPEIIPGPSVQNFDVTIDESRVVKLEQIPQIKPQALFTVVLADTGDPLPNFISLTLLGPDGSVRVLRSGTVYIQDWDLNDVISGEIKPTFRRYM